MGIFMYNITRYWPVPPVPNYRLGYRRVAVGLLRPVCKCVSVLDDCIFHTLDQKILLYDLTCFYHFFNLNRLLPFFQSSLLRFSSAASSPHFYFTAVSAFLCSRSISSLCSSISTHLLCIFRIPSPVAGFDFSSISLIWKRIIDKFSGAWLVKIVLTRLENDKSLLMQIVHGSPKVMKELICQWVLQHLQLI